MSDSEAVLMTAPEAAELCRRGLTTWYRLHQDGYVPEPVRLGGGLLWRRAELIQWIEAGCPQRVEWEQRKGAKP